MDSFSQTNIHMSFRTFSKLSCKYLKYNCMRIIYSMLFSHLSIFVILIVTVEMIQIVYFLIHKEAKCKENKEKYREIWQKMYPKICYSTSYFCLQNIICVVGYFTLKFDLIEQEMIFVLQIRKTICQGMKRDVNLPYLKHDQLSNFFLVSTYFFSTISSFLCVCVYLYHVISL